MLIREGRRMEMEGAETKVVNKIGNCVMTKYRKLLIIYSEIKITNILFSSTFL